MQTKKRVLVVDDEPAILRFVSASLSLAGYEVVTTTSGEEALQLVQSEKFDVMLLDIVMVPVSGFDVIEKLRAFPRLPVIVFTANSFIAEKAFEHGAEGYIAKPFRSEELIRKIEDVLDKQKPEV